MADDFAARKRIGTDAETALRNLFTAAGAAVIAHQHNHDAAPGAFGAAVAHAAAARIHLPDLTVVWSGRSALPIYGVEAKAKEPLRRGGWGWDRRGFHRALAWSQLTHQPVFYVIRDTTAAPFPLPGRPDDVDAWCFASVWKLLHAPERHDDGRHILWPADVFLPLELLLHGCEAEVRSVPMLHLGEGAAPILL